MIEVRCKICSHPEADKINTMLVSGVSAGKVAEMYPGCFNRQSVWNHRKKHLPKLLVQAQQAQQQGKADELLQKLEDIHSKAWDLMQQAEKDKKYQPAISALKECRSCLELTARLIGELKTGVEVNIHYNPQWVELRGVIFKALERFPEARFALADELSKVEEGEIVDADIK